MSANDQWIPPHGELIKVNFDEAFDKDCLQSCSRIGARNAGDWVLVSRTILHENVTSAFAAKTLVCSWAVQTNLADGEWKTTSRANQIEGTLVFRGGKNRERWKRNGRELPGLEMWK
ncbi:hypothetical protein J1N35_005812 [Gossypium stocksii]|uniref:Uncharacterized protein n=1 Tax=Gossypium stocksii TaxID=47602 RepID=A0A9D3WEL5_9ROSI|nr:hypothetical protein J1N35_005812 [Gossypium stocksii]